jgi:hypothetical protein
MVRCISVAMPVLTDTNIYQYHYQLIPTPPIPYWYCYIPKTILRVNVRARIQTHIQRANQLSEGEGGNTDTHAEDALSE